MPAAQDHDIVTQHPPYRLECLRYDQSDGKCLQHTEIRSWVWAPQLVELPSQGSLFRRAKSVALLMAFQRSGGKGGMALNV